MFIIHLNLDLGFCFKQILALDWSKMENQYKKFRKNRIPNRFNLVIEKQNNKVANQT